MEPSDKRPYLLAAAGVLLVLLGGAFIVWSNFPASSSQGELKAWTGGGSALDLGGYGAASSGTDNRQTIMQQVQSGAPYDYSLPTLPAPQLEQSDDGTGFDFNAFVALLSRTSASLTATSSAEATSSSVESAYTYIPSGLISTAAHTAPKNATQAALYDYGNETGSFIQSFETEHPNSARVLKDQAEDRTDPTKAAALQKLGNDLAGVGYSILGEALVPKVVGNANQALGQSYVSIGTKLAAVTKATTDADFVAAVNAYNAEADIFIKNYVAVAQLFSAYSVSFSADEPGSVFVFSPTQL